MHATRSDIVAFVQEAGRRYWPNGPVPADMFSSELCDITTLGNDWVDVTLPLPHASLGVNGTLWVDRAALRGDGRCDWYLAAFSYLAGIAEVKHEMRHGPAHSFAYRLSGIPARCFDHAWANRILLVMRAMEAERRGASEEAIFGPLPGPEILLTHDVDALDKTLAIRLKQSLFELFNLVRFTLKGKIRNAADAFYRGLRMAFTQPAYLQLDAMADAAKARGLRAIYHIHARRPRRSLKAWLMDPGYHCADPRLTDFIARRHAEGFQFGLHPTYDSWNDATSLAEEHQRLAAAILLPITHIRQHWLRFSWRDTWAAHQKAGLSFDSTLGFNDRTGFRSGAALGYRPWNAQTGGVHDLTIYPLILMDSHLYSYNPMNDAERRAHIDALLAEVRAVHGVATVLWHPHTLSADYGWQNGYNALLDSISEGQNDD